MNKQFLYGMAAIICACGLTGCGKKAVSPEVPSAVPVIPTVPEPEASAEPQVSKAVDAQSIDFDMEPDEEPGSIEFDKIEAVVEGPDGPDLIATSDIHRRGFDGVAHTLDDIIDERLRDAKAQEFKIEATDESVDKYLATMSQGQPLSKEYLTEIAGANGYTLEGFYDELKRLYRSNNLINMEVNAKLDLSDEEVKKYYDENPVGTDLSYSIQTAFMSSDALTNPELIKRLHDKESSERAGLQWSPSIELREDDITEGQAFIPELAVGDIYVLENGNELIVYKMHARQEASLVPLEDRIVEIKNILGKAKYDKLFEELNKKLREESPVHYVDRVSH